MRGREKVAAAAGIRGLGARDFQIVTQRGRHRMELRREQSCVRSLCDSAMVLVGRGVQPRLRRHKINAALVVAVPIFWAGTLTPTASRCLSMRPRRKPRFLPKLLPVPDAGGRVQQPIPQLVRQHQNLAAMMRLVREHVSKHRPAGWPSLRPTPAREFHHTPTRRCGQSIRQHPQALRPTFPMCRSSLLNRAMVRIQRRRTLQMRRRILQPRQPAVVQMREYRRDRSAAALFSRQLRTPSTRVQLRQNKLVHRVVARISFQQRIANLSQPRLRLKCQVSPAVSCRKTKRSIRSPNRRN